MAVATAQLQWLCKRVQTDTGAEATKPVLQQWWAASLGDPVDFLGEWRDIPVISDPALSAASVSL